MNRTRTGAPGASDPAASLMRWGENQLLNSAIRIGQAGCSTMSVFG